MGAVETAASRPPSASVRRDGDRARARVAALYEAHADFVWRTLARFGVAEPDRVDMMQEVFIVAHRKLDAFRGACSETTWLFGISRRVAAGYRRRAHRRREAPVAEVPEAAADDASSPEAVTARRQARAIMDRLLEELNLDQRLVFVMFELDGASCREIAEVTGWPLGTVFSRLRAARQRIERALARERARDRGRSP